MNSGDSIDETKLIHRAQWQGDTAAFSILVKKHQASLRSFLVRLCKNYDLADDLAQDTFIIAFEKLRSYQAKGSFAAWLFRIGFNCFLQGHRRDKRAHQVVKEYTEIVDVNPSHYDNISPEQLDLERAMLQLNGDESAAISLCHSFGFSHTEVAVILNKPLGTVKSNINRGKQKLREYLIAGKMDNSGNLQVKHHPVENAS